MKHLLVPRLKNGNHQIFRQWEMLRYLHKNRYSTFYTLADHFSVSHKTIRRDVADLQFYGFPVVLVRVSGDENRARRFVRLRSGWCLCQGAVAEEGRKCS